MVAAGLFRAFFWPFFVGGESVLAFMLQLFNGWNWYDNLWRCRCIDWITLGTALPIWPIWPNFEVNGLDWIFIFSIVLGAEYLSYMKSIETHARAFLTLNILSIGTVYWSGILLIRSSHDLTNFQFVNRNAEMHKMK